MKTVPGFTLRPLGKEFIITAENIKQIDSPHTSGRR